MASFIEKVNALRAAFSVPSDVPLPNAIVGMSQSMGLPHKMEFHPLLEQVDTLLEMTGVQVGASAAEPAPAAAPAAVSPAVAPPAAAGPAAATQ